MDDTAVEVAKEEEGGARGASRVEEREGG